MWVGGWVRECQLATYGNKQGIQKNSEYWGKRDHKEFGEYLKNKEEKETRVYREYWEYWEKREYREYCRKRRNG